MSKMIVPQYKLLMWYDINRGIHETYFQFIAGEFVPTLQGLGLYMLQVYDTAFGHYPMRQLEFVAEDLETMQTALSSDTWHDLKARFDKYTSNYRQKIVRFRDAFQF